MFSKKYVVKRKHLTTYFFSCKIAKVIAVDDILEQALLYDFYGELLNDHQKEIYEQFILEDLSLSEIAESEGISRQGVHDLVKRCQKTLEGYEAKLHLVGRFLSIKKKVQEMESLLDSCGSEKENQQELFEQIKVLSGSILEIL